MLFASLSVGPRINVQVSDLTSIDFEDSFSYEIDGQVLDREGYLVTSVQGWIYFRLHSKNYIRKCLAIRSKCGKIIF